VNWFESIINFFNPQAGFKRLQFKKATDLLTKRSYEGASRSRRTENWRTRSTSQNAEAENQLETLRNRSRDLVRNNPYAKRAVKLIKTNTVGKGIMLNLLNPDEQAQVDQQLAWKQWAGSKKIDFDECMNFNAMQGLIMRSVAESGEVLVRRRRVRRANGSLGIKLQVLEADHLVTELVQRAPETNNRIIQGIELNDDGVRVAYHLFKNHPGNIGVDIVDAASTLDTVRVPASDIIHVFEKDRPGQLRGIPWLAAIVIRLRELDEFEDAMIVRQKIAACFSAFVHDIETPADLDNNSKGESDIEKLEPGTIEHLPPGKDIKFGTPPLPQGEAYKFFISSMLHSIAVGIGVSYEGLTGDLSEVNFSSARMGWLEFGRNIDDWRANMLIPQFNDQVLSWFLEAIDFLGQDVSNTEATWTAPRREMVDPTKEIPAKIKSMRAGISTLSDTIRENGKEPNKHFDELKADNEKIDSLGLVLDSDPRKTTAAGMFQIEEDDGDGDGESQSARQLELQRS
jgi:lambda family phage portal protein